MTLWNEVHSASPRNAVLAYATLLETALQAMLAEHGLPGKDENVGAMVYRLLYHGAAVPDALNATTGPPKELYSRRNVVSHDGERVTSAQAQQARDAATALLRAYPVSEPNLAEFLRAPHRNAFAPQRRPELAELLRRFLIT